MPHFIQTDLVVLGSLPFFGLEVRCNVAGHIWSGNNRHLNKLTVREAKGFQRPEDSILINRLERLLHTSPVYLDALATIAACPSTT